VVGHVPWRREDAFLRRIALLMGNRTQLVWDIPAADSFRVLQEIYRIPDDTYRTTVRELTDLLELEPLLHKPVRNLSLGERMKVEFAAGLLHGPQVAFLDEPTLGLDVSMQSRIRRFVAEWNRRTGATILLTSHYMDDVVALCKRVIVIHRGRLLYDGELGELAQRMAPYKVITVALRNGAGSAVLDELGTVVRREESSATVHVPREAAAERTARIVQALGQSLADISVEDPPIEEVIDRVFAGEAMPEAVPAS
jgi:ABC-2 type transport system ATP-binding protein